MYVRREELRKEFPDMHHLDVTKKIGEEWMALSDEQKKPYLDAALDDKIRYKKEMKEYWKSLVRILLLIASNRISFFAFHQYFLFFIASLTEQPNSGKSKKPIKRKKSKKTHISTDTDIEPSPKKTKRRAPSSDQFEFSSTPKSSSVSNKPSANANANASITTPMPTITSINTPPPSPPQSLLSLFGDIPIFTEKFIEHNRQMESELKKLRKMNTDIEQQNSVLEKYAESVQIGTTKTAAEIDELNEDNEKLTTYLTELRTKLANQLQNLSIPSEPNGATIENIDKFMGDLFDMAQTNEHGPASLNKAKDLLRKVDLNIDVKKLQKMHSNAIVSA